MKAIEETQEHDITFLSQRRDRVENENRKLKRLILGVTVIGVALLAMGQTRPKAVPRIIEAEKFVLKDESGKENGWLQVTPTGPELRLTQSRSGRAASTSITPATLHLLSTGEKGGASGIMGPGGLTFFVSEDNENKQASMNASGPTITIEDKQGFQTVIGVTDLETPKTGETRKTSAASVIVFDKDKTVIWKAPNR